MDKSLSQLSRREREIMDIIFELGEATAVEIQDRLQNAPTNSSVRVLLRILEDKGYLRHRRQSGRYIYTATIEQEKAEQSALQHLIKTFFGGSTPRAVAALLSTSDLSEQELEELSDLIKQAKGETNDRKRNS